MTEDSDMEGKPMEGKPVIKEIGLLPGYGVDDEGNPWSRHSPCRTGPCSNGPIIGGEWKPLKPEEIKGGYLRVNIMVNGKPKKVPVSHMVLMAHVGPRPAGMEACHNDGKRQNNRPDNLRWDTRLNNQRDRIAHGTVSKGSKSGRAKLTEDTAREALQLRSQGMTYQALAKRFGVGPSAIQFLCNRTTWKHI